jgi:hypothetical protein
LTANNRHRPPTTANNNNRHNNNSQQQQLPTTTANNNRQQQEPPTTRNAASNNSELDLVKKDLRSLLFNNKHFRFSKVQEFKLDFDSFALTRGHFGAVHARTLVANPKAKSRAALRINLVAITKRGDNADERALALHLSLIKLAMREIYKSAGIPKFENQRVGTFQGPIKRVSEHCL